MQNVTLMFPQTLKDQTCYIFPLIYFFNLVFIKKDILISSHYTEKWSTNDLIVSEA